jgi:adenosylcobinamide kinase / adenosylcobinamide-phosphate guanylyltransferase
MRSPASTTPPCWNLILPGRRAEFTPISQPASRGNPIYMSKKLSSFLLILGGARSGKSRYALQVAEKTGRRPLFIAAAEARDAEMRARIRRHRKERGENWLCAEEPLEVAGVLRNPPAPADVILFDCATLWLSNVFLKEGPAALTDRTAALLAAIRAARLPVIIVANEVGLGIVPAHRLGREFRDHAGRLNQDLARQAQTVVLMVAGLPLGLKGRLPCAG